MAVVFLFKVSRRKTCYRKGFPFSDIPKVVFVPNFVDLPHCMERDIQPLLNTLCTAEQNAAVHNGSCTALAGALLPIEETSSDS
ncbi:unnamed protein product [Callosobruchus maculatus]|uniref:Uncharacterized protein n=1 Tax=Callosobruchus maculatus TaxID=64391 RepID=A0A653C2H0_CALMS|nr:unnamed protein product [Callosobruchus maculatus]